ncbi:MAG: hypothetical protein IPM50_10105 [Acidobacteriota bacterium]|nr:MAG: hypothetical protein IPM50_10105 [Acidobacteriota bacterium]
MKETSRYIAIFVVAFLCLNLGGALCFTHCALERASAEDEFAGLSDHCKAIKLAEQAENKDDSATNSEVSVCCAVPTALVAAPTEKKVELQKVVAAALAAELPNIPLVAASRNDQTSIPVYRPPPLDRRGERLLHCVHLI